MHERQKCTSTDALSRLATDADEVSSEHEECCYNEKVVAHALYDLSSQITNAGGNECSTEEHAQLHNIDTMSEDAFPLSCDLIEHAQQTDHLLMDTTHNKKKGNSSKAFDQGNEATKVLVNKNNKMLVPKSLQQHAVEWNHANLMHPGLICAESATRQHSHWKTLREDV